MDMLSWNEIRSLMQKHMGICVSIYMPTLGKGVETQQNQIRYKNLIREADQHLISNDLSSSEVKALMSPAQELLGDQAFWRSQGHGLALFLSDESARYYRLPQTCDELVVVADRFHLKPLIPMLSSNVEFYVLAVSQKKVRLFKSTQYSTVKIDIEGIPENLTEALNLDDFEKHLQLHTGTEDLKANILRYLQQVDRGLHEFLRDKRAPLVFAGVDYIFPIYKEANTYPHLMAKAVSGNPEPLGPDKLRDLAWAIVGPFFDQEKTGSVAQYRQNVGTGLASSDVREIVLAAHHKRVSVLFVPVGVQRWGIFDPDTEEVNLNRNAGPGHQDLLDYAAIQTILNGGTVYAVNPDEMPDNAPIAAVFRY